MKKLALLVSTFALCAALPAIALDYGAGLALTLNVADTTFSGGVPIALNGQLLAGAHVEDVEAATGVPGRTIELLVDGAVVKSMTGDGQGAYSTSVTFDASQTTHTIQAVAFRGTPVLETRSPQITMTIDRILIGLRVSPSAVMMSAGQTTQLHAIGEFSDGREYDITEQATWSSSDPSSASVSDASGTKGRVTAISPSSSVTIVASSESFSATGNLSIS